jgi:hypothetical protein
LCVDADVQQARAVLAAQFHLSRATLQVEIAGNHHSDEMTR